MSRKPKLKQIKQALGGTNTKDINGMFEEMMGMKDAEIHIILPKFVGVRNKIIHVYKILMQFSTGAICSDFKELSSSMEQIKKFATELRESIVFSDVATEETEEQYKTINKETLNSLYKKLKNNQFTQRLVVLCSTMKQYSKNFEDVTQLKDNFIKQEPGLSFYIFDFSDLDLKKIWANDRVTSMVKKYILNILHVLYKDLYNIYQTITSPDVDIDKFTEVLLNAIDQLKKQPGLHRCENAFRRIASSVELLKSKFSNYYRDSVASSNPNMLIENFIIDVSNQGGADARLTREFRQIIQHMNKVSEQSGKNKDPAVQKLFSMLNKNFEVMERGAKGSTSDRTNWGPAEATEAVNSTVVDSALDNVTDNVTDEKLAKAAATVATTAEELDDEELDDEEWVDEYNTHNTNLYTLIEEDKSNTLVIPLGFKSDGSIMYNLTDKITTDNLLVDSSNIDDLPELIEETDVVVP
jgi:hypothetical protein